MAMELSANTLVIAVSVLLSGLGISVTVGMWAGRLKSIVESLQTEIDDLKRHTERHESRIGHLTGDVRVLKTKTGLDNGTPGTEHAQEQT
jgi:hypothetical protein